MQQPDYSAIGKIMELLNNSKDLRRLAWGILVVAALFALSPPDLVAAIRWW